MDTKKKAIIALLVDDELPEIEVNLSGKFGAPDVRKYLEEVIDNAITELITAAIDRNAEFEANAKADISAIKAKEIAREIRNA